MRCGTAAACPKSPSDFAPQTRLSHFSPDASSVTSGASARSSCVCPSKRAAGEWVSGSGWSSSSNSRGTPNCRTQANRPINARSARFRTVFT